MLYLTLFLRPVNKNLNNDLSSNETTIHEESKNINQSNLDEILSKKLGLLIEFRTPDEESSQISSILAYLEENEQFEKAIKLLEKNLDFKQLDQVLLKLIKTPEFSKKTHKIQMKYLLKITNFVSFFE